jgi:hypothetical protein
MQTKPRMAMMTALAALLVLLCLGATKQPAPLKPLNLEKIQGQVRVVLLRAGQVGLTNNQPEFIVTYVVEIPSKGAFSDLHFYSTNEIELKVNGKTIEWRGGFSSGAMGFNDLPRQNELSKPKELPGKSMLAQDTVFDGLKIDAKKIDVKLQFTWRGSQQVFEFKDVPLN